MAIIAIGIDLAKNVFAAHGVDEFDELTLVHPSVKVKFPGHSDVNTTVIYTHVLKVAAGGTASPLDALMA